jgi:2-keto-4-pentenoate hydratase/2-oxohepta-3-ene-1,7-dioic acid hydratase in catechol pathway
MRVARARFEEGSIWGQVDGDVFRPLDGDPLDGARPNGEERTLATVDLLAPTDPHRAFAVLGGFWPDGEDPPDPRPDPLLIPKIVTAVSGPDAEVFYPPFVKSISIEAELALVVGRTVHRADPDEAEEAIWGYTCFNDVTAMEFAPQFYLAKCLDTFASMGPWITTEVSTDDIKGGLAIEARVNGEPVQSGNTRRFKHLPCEVLSYISRFMTLERGDVITLGTPPPAADVVPGDVAEIEVEGVGVLTNHIVAEP